MKNIFYSAVLAAGLVFTSSNASAIDLFGGLGTAVTGQVGVSAPINNTPVYAPGGGDIDAQNRYIYQRDSLERTARQRLQTGTVQDMSIAPADIAPAAGISTYTYKKLLPAYNMGRIQGGHSYND